MFTPSTAKFVFQGSNPKIHQDWQSLKLAASFVWLALNTPITLKKEAK